MSQTLAEVMNELEGDEGLKVFAWRLFCLERAGYDVGQATLIARDARIDLHLAVALPSRGCPHERAVEILT